MSVWWGRTSALAILATLLIRAAILFWLVSTAWRHRRIVLVSDWLLNVVVGFSVYVCFCSFVVYLHVTSLKGLSLSNHFFNFSLKVKKNRGGLVVWNFLRQVLHWSFVENIFPESNTKISYYFKSTVHFLLVKHYT